MIQDIQRCVWVGDDPLYRAYHDQEWGRPVYNDQMLFEFLILEGAQAGLSWITILRKREAYRTAFDDFDVAKVAQYGETKIAELLQNQGIVRNQLKINAAVKNARAFLRIQQELGGFSDYIWQFVEGRPMQNSWSQLSEIPASTALSDALAKDLKKRGFSFVGGTIMYAFYAGRGHGQRPHDRLFLLCGMCSASRERSRIICDLVPREETEF